MKEISLIIHDVRSVHNVGSLFRTADGMGVKKIYLTGYTPGPIDRFGREVDAFTKVSLGAEKTVEWEKEDSIDAVIVSLKKENVQIVALEQDENSIPLNEFSPLFPIALVVGNEVDGVSKEVLEKVDKIVEIPMRGEKESFNVANAGAIALYALNNSPHQ